MLLTTEREVFKAIRRMLYYVCLQTTLFAVEQANSSSFDRRGLITVWPHCVHVAIPAKGYVITKETI